MVQEAGPLEDREAGLTDSGGPDGPDATQASVDVCVSSSGCLRPGRVP